MWKIIETFKFKFLLPSLYIIVYTLTIRYSYTYLRQEGMGEIKSNVMVCTKRFWKRLKVTLRHVLLKRV